LGATLPNQIQPIHVGKAEINDEGIVNAFQSHGFPGLRVTGRIHLISSLYQGAFQEQLNGDVILD
jgi:hypothetical protein